MGWKLRLLASLFLLLAISYRAWLLIPAPLFYLLAPLLRGRKRTSHTSTANREVRLKRPSHPKVPRIRLAGLLFLILALIGYAGGGLYAPTILAAVGCLLISWARISRSPALRGLTPAKESCLLRSRLIPFSWYILCELKLTTSRVSRALSGISHTLIILAQDDARIFVLLHIRALGHTRAEGLAASKIRELVRQLTPLGAYPLPLDSQQAARVLPHSLEHIELNVEGWLPSIATTPSDMICLQARDGFVKSLGLYRVKNPQRGSAPAVPPLPNRPRREALLWEVLKILESRLRWPPPDKYTLFLASLYATRRTTIGERLLESPSPDDPQTILVEGLGTPTLELTRGQLRMLMKAYREETS
jgi:hypothetical protein